MGYTPDSLKAMLERINQQKQIDPYSKTRPWTDFQPQQLSWQKPNDLDAYKSLQDQTMQNDQQATAVALVKAQNQAQYNQLQQQQQLNNVAQQNAIKPNGGGHGLVPANAPLPPWSNGGPLADLNPKAKLKTYDWRGFNLTLNSSVASRFISFLDALWKKGYKPKTIGSYADRNIAGTNTPSLHSLGLAIDIDPGLNPVNRDKNHKDDVFALPPGVGALAAKYGLNWGGSWNSYKDYMHFSVPYGGRQ